MRVVPKKKSERLSFFTTHIERWAEQFAAIGVTEAEVAQLAGRLVAAKAAYDAQQQARNAYRAATQLCDSAMASLGNEGAMLIAKMRATAMIEGDQVYADAAISPPAKASPIGPPGKPEGFAFTMQQVGILTLTWTCKNPRGSQGTMYRISRSIDGGRTFTFLAVVGKKRFDDETLPPGTPAVEYQVQGIRSTTTGPVNRYLINLGVAPGSIPPTINLKNAA